MTIIIVLSCLISGFLGHGLTMGHFIGEYPRSSISPVPVSWYMGVMCALPILGLFALLLTFGLSEFGRHGLRLNHDR